MMFKGSNFYSVWKNPNQLCPHLAASESFEVCSMLISPPMELMLEVCSMLS
jgi:hypothetical protein